MFFLTSFEFSDIPSFPYITLNYQKLKTCRFNMFGLHQVMCKSQIHSHTGPLALPHFTEKFNLLGAVSENTLVQSDLKQLKPGLSSLQNPGGNLL